MPLLTYLSKTYPRSLWFCLRYLPFRQALRVPILVSKLKVGTLRRGDIVFTTEPRRARVVLGFTGTERRDSRAAYLSVHDGGKLVLGEHVTIARGTAIVINGARLSIGNNFFCNGDCFFTCDRDITIGNDNLYGWRVEMNTTDGHDIFENGQRKERSKPITIGNHVWICSGSHIGKGVVIADDCVVAQRSLVIKKHFTPHTLIGGMPAKDIKNGIAWKG